LITASGDVTGKQ